MIEPNTRVVKITKTKAVVIIISLISSGISLSSSSLSTNPKAIAPLINPANHTKVSSPQLRKNFLQQIIRISVNSPKVPIILPKQIIGNSKAMRVKLQARY